MLEFLADLETVPEQGQKACAVEIVDVSRETIGT
jgi:hypothetical protein